ncbi:MAG: type VI secretion system baseplate subunit TssE [Phycisphaerae bacterium]
MAAQRTLLERIRHPDPSGERRMRVSSREVFDSIIGNLQRVLNTCQGNCLTDQRYGLPHLTEVRSAMPHSIGGLESSIRGTIERHEPRLKNVRVRHSPGPESRFELRFEISGMVIDEDQKMQVRFETVADDEGRMLVR